MELFSGHGNHGNGLLIDSHHRLHGDVVQDTRLADSAAIDRKAFFYASGVMAAAASENILFYYKNTSTEGQNFHIDRLILGWSPGTTPTALTKLFFYLGAQEPTAGQAVLTPGNMFIGDSTPSPSETYQWDTVTSTGMSVVTPTPGLPLVFGAGMTLFPLNGAFIVPPSISLALAIDPDEAGEIVIGAIGYYKKTNSLLVSE